MAQVFSAGRKALIVYLTAGYPEPGVDGDLALEAIDAGADVLELGFPFSDPVADGPLIQEASGVALRKGMTLSGTLQLAAWVRERRQAPIVLMGYANPVYHMGYEAFADGLARAGGDGAIIPDLPMEAAAPLRTEMRDRGLALIPMAAPNTPASRLRTIIGQGDGFLYVVSMAGLTGDAPGKGAGWQKVASLAREASRLPVCVGFGIRTGREAAEAARHADGVIVGSAITRIIREAPGRERAREGVRRLVGELAEAVRRG
ncbi:MAG: tryptophan synthase subunit alpha [bacterium]|nr:MAG: tryptophan synthase subunit alpha [bacterium]